MYVWGFASKTGTSPIEPSPIKAFDCIVFIRIPSARERLSIISNPTLCLVPWYLLPGLPKPTTSHGVYST
uniref:Uncharacterized protein n=1 Tax=Lotus japonicus TaxID=34305 RepID=I3RZE9_LOTJA|nr:unknown [Lotus japonicus]